MNKKRLNNEGSTLVAVLIVIAIVGILAASLCIMTMVNSQMKRVDRKARDTFYSAETALDEITLGLQNDLAQSTKDAYGWLLVNYLSESSDPDEKDRLFKGTVCTNLINILQANISNTSQPSTEEITESIKTKLNSYLTDDMKNYATVTDVADYVKDDTNKYIIIKAVTVEYVNGDYSNTITTDIRITIPEAQFSVDLPYTSELPFQSYAVMAKETITVGSGDNLEINGNIYAGGNSASEGIEVSHTGIADFKSTYIITGGDVNLNRTTLNSDGTSLKISPLSSAVNIWAMNININKGTTNLTGKSSYDLVVDTGSVNVYNDLALDAAYSRVKISGAYTGFGSSLTEADKSAAIIVNGVNSKLDLSDCLSLSVFGRAFIAFPETTDTSSTDTTKIMIPTGESVTVRGNQIAYLVPSSCISIKRNPVSLSEAEDLLNDFNSSFDFTALDKINLADYCDTTAVDAKTFRVTNNGQAGCTVYFYLKFLSDEKRKQFFIDYCDAYGTSGMASIFKLEGNNGLETCIDRDENGNIISSGTINTSGTAVAQYINDGTASEVVTSGNGSGSITADAAKYQSMYVYLKSTLRSAEDEQFAKAIEEYGISNYKSRDAVSNLLKFDLIKEYFARTGTDVYRVSDPSNGYTLIVKNGSYTVDRNMTGIIIATGDVTVDSGVQFEGLIVCGCDGVSNTGRFKISGSATLTASKDVVSYIIGKTDTYVFDYTDRDGVDQHLTIGDFFIDPRVSQITYVPSEDVNETEDQELDTLITYENWVKS